MLALRQADLDEDVLILCDNESVLKVIRKEDCLGETLETILPHYLLYSGPVLLSLLCWPSEIKFVKPAAQPCMSLARGAHQ